MSIATHLGQKSEYKTQYDPELLVREPRQSNRTYLGIDDNNLPFQGFDVWNGWEVSALTTGGIPVSLIAKIKYPANSKYIVESKSIKLYFNSFNMTQLGKNAEEVRSALIGYAHTDLSTLLETKVEVEIWTNTEVIQDMALTPYNPGEEYIGSGYTLEEVVDLNLLTTTQYTEDPSLLELVHVDYNNAGEIAKVHSSALMSRCKVTNQPDTGDIFIMYEVGDNTVTDESLLKYIVSFRGENHFHEEICEAVFVRLLEALKPKNLAVACLYSRRGGWDINPVRYTDGFAPSFESEVNPLADVYVMHNKLPRQ